MTREQVKNIRVWYSHSGDVVNLCHDYLDLLDEVEKLRARLPDAPAERGIFNPIDLGHSKRK